MAFTYDSDRNTLSRANSGGATHYGWDFENRLTRSTAPDGFSTSFGYDYRGRRTSVTDANGKTTSYQYDDADRLGLCSAGAHEATPDDITKILAAARSKRPILLQLAV